MLATEEVDDDYFTPVGSTSLANIFGHTTKTDEQNDNTSLKYTPPKQNGEPSPKMDEPKATTCLFACALLVYEWSNNAYSSRGKLGFAILKVHKNNLHNIILYDSNKTTLSSTTVSPKLKVTLKNSNFLTYYDDFQKCWSIYGSDAEMQKIVTLLKTLGIDLSESPNQQEQYINASPPSHNNEIHKLHPALEETLNETESDTDSLINRKTKSSILNRMANMGHSVLPQNTISTDKASDSSDTNDSNNPYKSVRHKMSKGVVKKNMVDKNTLESHFTDLHKKGIVSRTDTPIENISVHNIEQSVALPNTKIITNLSSGNELGLFMSEQRINNSELRININRISDKIDSVLSKATNFDRHDSGESFNTQTHNVILNKLLNEYENKIKLYEEMLASPGPKEINKSSIAVTAANQKIIEDEYTKKINELHNLVQNKNQEITRLQEEISNLKDSQAANKDKNAQTKNILMKKIASLEKELSLKSDELLSTNSKLDLKTDERNNEVSHKVKKIMNDTFQAISVNFENSETYSGEAVKNLIASVIRKVTVDALREFE